MNNDLYCSMIHGGLYLNLKSGSEVKIQHCCLRDTTFVIDRPDDFWSNEKFIPLREKNLKNEWDPGCYNCQKLEKAGLHSFRQGMNDGLGIFGKTNVSGPARIDLTFDISCNLACRICRPESSTFWQKHLKENNMWPGSIFTPRNKNDVIKHLECLDLSNLRQVVFCGGETLLGQEYWDMSEWLVNNVPNAKNQLMLCFQTNGTQPILEKNYKIIEKTHMVKLHISIDGIEKRFEYMRWPADWNQVTENIQNIRSTCPSNVMFVVEETISIFNLAYLDECTQWVNENFNTNRFGDRVDHTRHLAKGTFSVNYCSQEYVDFISKTPYIGLISPQWKENKDAIEKMIAEIKKFDGFRKQNFPDIFPEVADMYCRFW